MSNSSLVNRLQGELQEGTHTRQLQYEVNTRLQTEHDQLLKRLAEAENHIDRLRLGANLELKRHFVVTHEHHYGDGIGDASRAEPATTAHQPPHYPPVHATRTDTSTGTTWEGLIQDIELPEDNLTDTDERLLTLNPPSPQHYTLDINIDHTSEHIDHTHLPEDPPYEDTSSLSTDGDISQMSATRIVDRASAESIQYAHLLKVKSLQGKIAELKSKLNEGGSPFNEGGSLFNEGGSPFNEVLTGLQEVQRDHAQLSEDINESQATLEALKNKYKGKASRRIASSQQAIGNELATLADQLSDFVQLLQLTAEPSQTSTSSLHTLTPSPLHPLTPPPLHTPHKTRDRTPPLLLPPPRSESALHAQINEQWSPQPVEDDSDSIVCSELSYDSSPFLSSKYFSSTLDMGSHETTVDPLELSHDGVYRTDDGGKCQTHTTEQTRDAFNPSLSPPRYTEDTLILQDRPATTNKETDPRGTFQLSDAPSITTGPRGQLLSDAPSFTTGQRSHAPAFTTGQLADAPSTVPRGQLLDAPSTVPRGQLSDAHSTVRGQLSDAPSTVPRGQLSDAHSTVRGQLSDAPSTVPRGELSDDPSTVPRGQLSDAPSTVPRGQLLDAPSTVPRGQLSDAPSTVPRGQLLDAPSTVPRGQLSDAPSTVPRGQLLYAHSTVPRGQLLDAPSTVPRGQLSDAPSTVPRGQPSDAHSFTTVPPNEMTKPSDYSGTGQYEQFTAIPKSSHIPRANHISQSTRRQPDHLYEEPHLSSMTSRQSLSYTPSHTGLMSAHSTPSHTGLVSAHSTPVTPSQSSSAHVRTSVSNPPLLTPSQTQDHPLHTLTPSQTHHHEVYKSSYCPTSVSDYPQATPSHLHTSRQPPLTPSHLTHSAQHTLSRDTIGTSSTVIGQSHNRTKLSGGESSVEEKQDYTTLTVSAIDQLRAELDQLKEQIMRSSSSVILTHPHRRHSDHSSTPPTHYGSYHTPHSSTHHASSREAHPHKATPIYASSSFPSHTSLVASPPHTTPPHTTPTSPRRSVRTEQVTTIELSTPEGHLLSTPFLHTPLRTISTVATPHTTPSHGMELDTAVSNNHRSASSRNLSTKARHFRADSTPQFSDNSTPLRHHDLFDSNARLDTPASTNKQSSRNSPAKLSNSGAPYSKDQNTKHCMISSTKRPSNDPYSVEGENVKRGSESFERRPSVDSSISKSKSGLESSSRFSRSSSFERQTREFDDVWSCPQCGGKGTSSTSLSPGGTHTQTRSHKCTQVYTSPTHTINTGGITTHGRDRGNRSTKRDRGSQSTKRDRGSQSTKRDRGTQMSTADHGTQAPSDQTDKRDYYTQAPTTDNVRTEEPSFAQVTTSTPTKAERTIQQTRHVVPTSQRALFYSKGSRSPSPLGAKERDQTREEEVKSSPASHLGYGSTQPGAIYRNVATTRHCTAHRGTVTSQDGGPTSPQHTPYQSHPTTRDRGTVTSQYGGPTSPQHTPYQSHPTTRDRGTVTSQDGGPTSPQHTPYQSHPTTRDRGTVTSQYGGPTSPQHTHYQSHPTTRDRGTVTSQDGGPTSPQHTPYQSHPTTRDTIHGRRDCSNVSTGTRHTLVKGNYKHYTTHDSTPTNLVYGLPTARTPSRRERMSGPPTSATPSRREGPTTAVTPSRREGPTTAVTPSRRERMSGPHIAVTPSRREGPPTAVTPSRRERVAYVSASPSDDELYFSEPVGTQRIKVKGGRRLVVRPVHCVVRGSGFNADQEVKMVDGRGGQLDLSQALRLAKTLKRRSRHMQNTLREELAKQQH